MAWRDDLGPVRQVGYVVHDLDAAIRHWTELLGVGPFFYIERMAIRDYTYAGRASAPHVSGALGQSGDLQIELICPRDTEWSMWRTFLQDGGEGLHHVAFWTREYERDLRTLIGRGMTVRHDGRSGGEGAGGRFAYLTPGADRPPVLELSELDDTKSMVFDMVAEAARDWDGSEPLRELRRPGPAQPA